MSLFRLSFVSSRHSTVAAGPKGYTVVKLTGMLLVLLATLLPPAFAEEITLSQALELFFKNNYDIIINRYEIDKSYADSITARLFPNPTISVNYQGMGPGFSRSDNTQNFYRIEQLIELGGKRGYRIKTAEQALEATRLGHKDTIRNLLVGFYTTYYNLVLTRLNLDFATEELKRYDKVLDIAEKRYKAGFLTFIDYTKLRLAKVDLENARTALATQHRNDLEAFALLLGGEPGYSPVPADINQTFPQFTEAGLVDAAYANRFDLLSLEKQERSAEAAIALAKAQRIPDVSIGGEYEQYGRHLESGRGVGIAVNIPLFYRYRGEILKRTAEHNQVKAQIEKTRKQIGVDVRQALNNYRAGLAIFDAYKTRKDEMDQLLGRTEKAFSIGGITVLDLLDTRRTYRDFITKYNQSGMQAMLNRELIKVSTGEIK